MRVLILTTFEKYGGAAMAAGRLYKALKQTGADVRYGFALGEPGSEKSNHILFTRSTSARWRFWVGFSWERLMVLVRVSHRKWLYKYSFGDSGLSIKDHPEVQQADIIHIHWVNFGFISIQEIVKLSQQKPVIWTFHDYWPLTGGCHGPQDCRGFEQDCRSCFYLGRLGNTSHYNLLYKANQMVGFQGQMVTVSQWMADQAKKSLVLRDCQCAVIGNPLDTEVFKSRDSKSLRFAFGVPEGAFCVLAGAADLTDENKGFAYFLEAIGLVKGQFHALIFGDFANPSLIPANVPFTVIGKMTGEAKLSEVYNLADVFVLPSLQESLSYMTMEAMACGKPVVAFDSGGVRDLVLDGETGFLITKKDAAGMASALDRLIANPDLLAKLGAQARAHVEANFSESVVANKYLECYESLR